MILICGMGVLLVGILIGTAVSRDTKHINWRLSRIMADIETLQNTLDAINQLVLNVKGDVDALLELAKAQDLSGVIAKAEAIKTALEGLDAQYPTA